MVRAIRTPNAPMAPVATATSTIAISESVDEPSDVASEEAALSVAAALPGAAAPPGAAVMAAEADGADSSHQPGIAISPDPADR